MAPRGGRKAAAAARGLTHLGSDVKSVTFSAGRMEIFARRRNALEDLKNIPEAPRAGRASKNIKKSSSRPLKDLNLRTQNVTPLPDSIAD